jgi:hypothetical protein
MYKQYEKVKLKTFLGTDLNSMKEMNFDLQPTSVATTHNSLLAVLRINQ